MAPLNRFWSGVIIPATGHLPTMIWMQIETGHVTAMQRFPQPVSPVAGYPAAAEKLTLLGHPDAASPSLSTLSGRCPELIRRNGAGLSQ
jgi:hypothetical protein